MICAGANSCEILQINIEPERLWMLLYKKRQSGGADCLGGDERLNGSSHRSQLQLIMMFNLVINSWDRLKSATNDIYLSGGFMSSTPMP